MEITKKQPALLYLDKNGFYLFVEGSLSVLSMGFPENVVRDMDIINPPALESQIKTFVDQNQMKPISITMILSPNVTFEKDIVELLGDEQTKAVNKFVDTIPFENVLSKTYPIEKGVKVIGFNEDLYLELRMDFEKSASGIESVIPYQMLGNDQALLSSLTPDSASQILKKVGSLKQYTLLTPQKKVQNTPPPATDTTTTTTSSSQDYVPPKKKNIRLFVMIGVFGLLFAVLGYMLFTMK